MSALLLSYLLKILTCLFFPHNNIASTSSSSHNCSIKIRGVHNEHMSELLLEFGTEGLHTLKKSAQRFCSKYNIQAHENWVIESYLQMCHPDVNVTDIINSPFECSVGYAGRYHTHTPTFQVIVGPDSYMFGIRCGENPYSATSRFCFELSIDPTSTLCGYIRSQISKKLRYFISITTGMPDLVYPPPSLSDDCTKECPSAIPIRGDEESKNSFFSLTCDRRETNFISNFVDKEDGALALQSFPWAVFNSSANSGTSADQTASRWLSIMSDRLASLPPAVTVVITSCNRTSLLLTTLSSFLKHNSYPIARMVIVEDSPLPQGSLDDLVSSVYPPFPVDIIYNEVNIGQIASIDKAYSTVDTPFIFHLEDDWEFYASGFIEESLGILQADPAVVVVSVRAYDDHNTHPLESIPMIYSTGDSSAPQASYRYFTRYFAGIFSGFGLHPGLRRTIDYLKVAPFQCSVQRPHFRNAVRPHEEDLHMMYNKLNVRGAVTSNEWGFVRHIGYGYHVPLETDTWNGWHYGI